jgi:hypothetical protein
MSDLYQNLGFKSNPFSKFSAEEEKDYLTSIYMKPRYYNTLLNDLSNGTSRFIFGQRGSGKSALIIELDKELMKNNAFSLIIDSYDDIPLKENDSNLILLIIKKLIKSYVIYLSKNNFLLKNLNKSDKEKLSLIVKDFYKSLSRREFENAYNQITKYKTRNFFRNIYNNIINKPLNVAVSTGLEIGSDFIRKSFNLPEVNTSSFYKNYFPAIDIEKIPDEKKHDYFIEKYDLLKDILLDLVDIIGKSGFKSVVIFFDKIDEFKKLEGKISKIVQFTEEILKDTNLLYFNNLSIVFSIWTEVKSELNARGVRFDKFKPVDITWTNNDLKQILQNRLDHFAINKPFKINKLLTENKIDNIIDIAYKSPRDLIRLLSTIYDEQENDNPNSKILDDKNIEKGILNFCKNYDYYSIFPSKKGTKEDIISIVNRILKVGRITFRATDLATAYKFSSQSANSYIKIMKSYALIKDVDESSSGPREFNVIDPKLKYLINKNIYKM